MKSRSKKIILLFSTFSILGGVFFLLMGMKKEPPAKTKAITEVKVVRNPAEIMNVDSDGDGVKDWEETLWGLDPHNPDTGNTGVPDAEKVRRKMKEIDEKSLNNLNGNIAGNQYATDTETNLLGKKLFAEYINLKQSRNLNDDSINKAMMNLVSEIRNKDTVTYYFVKDLKTFPDSDKLSVKKYGNSFAMIRNKYDSLYMQNPVVGSEDPAGITSPEFTRGVARASDLYLKMTQELSKLQVPKGLADAHTEILNDYRASAEGLKGFGSLGNDPIVAMIGLQKHSDAASKENNLLRSIADYFLKNGIIFSEEESGNFWNKI
ncbi:hypothetical protein KGQ29_01380 [Patescibacteria group bacterium]|nr:hypothetical protein [Patescibacteria group bacterium]MDE1988129.1 hypothetical protein [Patescibacteria group bacterium]